MKRHLTADAAAPLTDAELATLDRHQDDSAGECLMPVPADASPLPDFKKHGLEADHRFEYRDADGQLLGYVLRWNAHNGARKEFWPATYWQNGAGEWRLRGWPTPRPLFGLDRLAKSPDAIVLLAEGEKAARAVEFGPLADAFSWGKCPVVGITWPGGTKAIGKVDFSPLAGRDVILLPDNDDPGEQAAEQLVDVLQRVEVRRLRRWKAPMHCPEGWDIADTIPEGTTPEALVESMLAASDIPAPRLAKTLAEFLAGFVPPDYLVEGILQRRFVYSLTAQTGHGKTAVALLLARF
jgi:putative DNA primase/helicase